MKRSSEAIIPLPNGTFDELDAIQVPHDTCEVVTGPAEQVEGFQIACLPWPGHGRADEHTFKKSFQSPRDEVFCIEMLSHILTSCTPFQIKCNGGKPLITYCCAEELFVVDAAAVDRTVSAAWDAVATVCKVSNVNNPAELPAQRETEALSCELISRIIYQVCAQLNLFVKRERVIINEAHTNRDRQSDYVVRDKYGTVVAVIEAKRCYSFPAWPQELWKAIHQCNGYLAHHWSQLRSTLDERDPCQLSGLATDGLRWIYWDINRHSNLFSITPVLEVASESSVRVLITLLLSRWGRGRSTMPALG